VIVGSTKNDLLTRSPGGFCHGLRGEKPGTGARVEVPAHLAAEGFGLGAGGRDSLLTATDHAVTGWLISGDPSDPYIWLASLTRRPSWHASAACRGSGISAFVGGRGANAAVMARARAICSTCPVTEECLDFALADPDSTGIWGGTTGRQRRAMRASMA
jgi:WhiB family redox-sensing transcriptional regulator